MTQQDQRWLRRFSQTIHDDGKDNLLINNGAPPMYDDSLSYDYIVTESYQLMFLNQLLGGRSFGKPFMAHCKWRQMYGWYVTLGQMYGVTADTSLKHRVFPDLVADTQRCPAFQLTEVPPGSITVMRFGKTP